MPPVRFPLRPVTLAAVLVLHTLSASAQTPGDPADDSARLPTVTVRASSADASAEGLATPYAGGQVARGSRIGVLGNQDMMETPFSVTSYTSQLIQDQQAKSVGDVLLNDASVRSARGFGNFQQAYYIRGFTVFSDDVAYNGLYGLVPRQYMATEFAERVEVFRGANTFLSGVGAGAVGGSGIGGLINVLPKRAPNEPLTRLTFGIQTGGQTQVALDAARRFGPDQSTGVRLNLAHHEGEGGVDDERQKLDASSIGLDWRSRNVRLSGDIGYQVNDLRDPRPSVDPTLASGVLKAPDADDNFAQPWTYSDSRDFFATARGEVDLNQNVTAWGAYGTRRSREANSLAGPTMVATDGTLSAYRFDNVRKDHIQTGEIGIRGKLQTGEVKHTVTASASAFRSKERGASAFSNFAGFPNNLYKPYPSEAPPTTAFASGQFDDPLLSEKVETSSVSLSDTLAFAQDRVLLTVGARHQNIKVTSYDNNTGTRSGDAYDESRTTPVAGVVYKATQAISVYANYIEGLVKGDTVTSGSTTLTLAPYVSRQREIGVKYDGGTLGGSVAYFNTRKPTAYGAGNTVIGRFGEQHTQGLEFSAFGQPVKGVRVLAGLTLLDADLENTPGGVYDGNEAVGVARHQLNLGADWDVPGIRGLAVNALLINTGRQNADAPNLLKVPSWTRFDLGARYLLDIGSDRVLTLRGRITNLFDKDYWESSGGYPGRGYVVLAQPRTLSLSASIDF
ncbi:MAG: TonB-dependent siderophore receptor [Rubrivivax sp.]|nr:MAG: TonB-dependent siderophore receptor [Rubrivivax sp.]